MSPQKNKTEIKRSYVPTHSSIKGLEQGPEMWIFNIPPPCTHTHTHTHTDLGNPSTSVL